jgi:aspartyl-tRNA(Asn)/glutamyl-tRNA(Gln) amidotransferase subunit A
MTVADELWRLDLAEVSDLIASGEVAVPEIVAATLQRIEEENDRLSCFITVLADEAIASAERLQKELATTGPRSAVHGIPISLKDNLMTAGVRTTVGSPLLRGWVPDRDAASVSELRQRGAVILGKTNLQQYAYGAPHPEFGEPLNPYHPDVTCGGSSSGSAAAVATGLGFGSVGTDTGGSIRIPAAFCGVVGLKPTYDLVSRAGAYPVSSNLDHVGPIARSVRDCAIMLDALVDRSRASSERSFLEGIDSGVDGLRLGVVRTQDRSLIAPDVQAAFERACHALEGEGASVAEIDLPDLHLAQLIMWVVSGVEAAELHWKDFRASPEQYTEVMRKRLEIAQFISGPDYVRAQRARTLFVDAVEAALEENDAILMPTVGVPPWRRGTTHLEITGRIEEAPNVGSRLTALFNVTGHPALALPLHEDVEGLPVSLQIAGRMRSEATVFQVGATHERLGERRFSPAGLRVSGGDSIVDGQAT